MAPEALPLVGVTICYVSAEAFSGGTRTLKQAQTVSAAGARVLFVGPEGLVPEMLNEPPFEVREVARRQLPAERFSANSVWLVRVALNLTVNRVVNTALRWFTRKHGDGYMARGLVKDLATEVVRSGADVVHSVDLPGLRCAHAARRKLRAKLVYDSHEYWRGFLKNPDLAAADSFAREMLSAESTLIGRADLVLVVSDAAGERLVADYGIGRPLTILNSPPWRVHEVRPVSRPVKLVFHGGLSADRNVDGLIRAMAYLRDRATLDIHGFGRTVSASSLQALVDELALRDAVTVRGPFAYEAVIETIRGYDVGVLTARMVDENFEIALPNKVFDCMCAGLAVAMSDSPAMRDLLDTVAFGVTLDPSTPETIAEGLDRLIGDPAAIAEMKHAAVSSSEAYWWPAQGHRLVDAIARLLG